MKTINTSLPVYDKLVKQCFEKGKDAGMDQPVTIKCPRHRLPSMLWNVETVAPGEITDIDLINKAGTAVDIINYFNITASYIQDGGGAGWASANYDTFISVNTAITSAIKTTAAGEAKCNNVVAAGSVPADITKGQSIRMIIDLTLNSGTAPKIELRKIGTIVSNTVTLANGINYVILTATSTQTSFVINIYNSNTELSNWSATFTAGEKTVIPHFYTALTDDYFEYIGDTLGTLLTAGIYYLKFTTNFGYIYYSDWFEVTCVYPNLVTSIINGNYDTFNTSGLSITSAINIAGNAYSTSNAFDVITGEEITVILFFTLNSGQLPDISIINSGATIRDYEVATVGLNVITLIPTWTGNAYLRFYSTAASSFATTEILVIRSYSETYLTINFHNTCDLGDILYADGLTQTIWFESETMENTYPIEEEGVKNGEALFVRSFARQTKKYLVRTKEMPAFMVEVFHRLKLHDTVELIDLVGDENTVYNLEVEHEWLWDDKYYAKLDLTFDYDETFVVGGCCNNIV